MNKFRIVGGDRIVGIKSEKCMSMAQFIGDNYPTKMENKKHILVYRQRGTTHLKINAKMNDFISCKWKFFSVSFLHAIFSLNRILAIFLAHCCNKGFNYLLYNDSKKKRRNKSAEQLTRMRELIGHFDIVQQK